MPRQHLPQHHGPIRHAGYGRQARPFRQLLHRLRGYQPRRDRKRRPLWNSAEAEGDGNLVWRPPRCADGKGGLKKE